MSCAQDSCNVHNSKSRNNKLNTQNQKRSPVTGLDTQYHMHQDINRSPILSVSRADDMLSIYLAWIDGQNCQPLKCVISKGPLKVYSQMDVAEPYIHCTICMAALYLHFLQISISTEKISGFYNIPNKVLRLEEV